MSRCGAASSSRPFSSSEEAWFWFIRCQQLRREGAKLDRSGSSFDRPCDPDDIYRAVIGLQRQGRIKLSHIRVLMKFGCRGSPPDERRGEEAGAHILWQEALDRLATVLIRKEIIA